MTKPKRPKTKKNTLPKLKEIYGRKAPDYARRPKKKRTEILPQMRDDAEATGLDKKLDVTPDDVVALQNTPKRPSAAESKPLDPKHPNRAPWREVVAEAWGKPEERSARKPTKKPTKKPKPAKEIPGLSFGDLLDEVFPTPEDKAELEREIERIHEQADRDKRREIIRRAAQKDRKVLDRLAQRDKKP